MACTPPAAGFAAKPELGRKALPQTYPGAASFLRAIFLRSQQAIGQAAFPCGLQVVTIECHQGRETIASRLK